MNSLGRIIQFLRKREGLTQEELGIILGVKKSAVQKYENGAITNLKIDVLRKLSQYFQVAPWIFIFPDVFWNLHDSEEYKAEYITEDYIYYDAVVFYKQYFRLTHYARGKVDDYINDLLKIEEYRRAFLD